MSLIYYIDKFKQPNVTYFTNFANCHTCVRVYNSEFAVWQ